MKNEPAQMLVTPYTHKGQVYDTVWARFKNGKNTDEIKFRSPMKKARIVAVSVGMNPSQLLTAWPMVIQPGDSIVFLQGNLSIS